VNSFRSFFVLLKMWTPHHPKNANGPKTNTHTLVPVNVGGDEPVLIQGSKPGDRFRYTLQMQLCRRSLVAKIARDGLLDP
jgi:hypothetical protein